jgi:hypothetical protein
MKAEKFNFKGYKFTVIGHIPTGQAANTMLTHAIFLGTPKGSFEMQVEHKGFGTISKIKFVKL